MKSVEVLNEGKELPDVGFVLRIQPEASLDEILNALRRTDVKVAAYAEFFLELPDGELFGDSLPSLVVIENPRGVNMKTGAITGRSLEPEELSAVENFLRK